MNNDLNHANLIRLSTLAEKTDISVHCIRNYVDQGLIQVCDRTGGGLLLFNETAIERLRFIKTARDAGVPLAKIVCLLLTSDNGDNQGIRVSIDELIHYIQDTRSKVSAFEQSLQTFGMINKLDHGVTQ